MGGKFSQNTTLQKNTTKRICDHVKAPIRYRIKIEDLFDKNDSPNLPRLKEHLINEGRLSEDLVLKIVDMARKLLKLEQNLINLRSPVNLVGDIHGQFYDLLSVFSLGGSPEEFKYLFLGDFVDRGMFSFECVLYLFSLKIKYPTNIYLLRGNHESRHLTHFFTFKDECLLKANEIVYDKIMETFDALPIAALIDDKFCKKFVLFS